jgi:hypothetical protein
MFGSTGVSDTTYMCGQVGYGMDWAQRFRSLQDICVIKRYVKSINLSDIVSTLVSIVASHLNRLINSALTFRLSRNLHPLLPPPTIPVSLYLLHVPLLCDAIF